MKTRLLLLFVLASMSIFAQCPPDNNQVFITQAQIDNWAQTYPSCTTINGDVSIGGTITNIDGLSAITTINGNLFVNGASLQNLNGFNNLTTVNGGINIDNSGITDTAIFNSLTQINGVINIQNNLGMVDFTGFNALISAPSTIQIINNLGMVSITGFSNLTTVGGNLSIIGQSAILPTTIISGFSNVQSVDYLVIRRTPLTNLEQFASLNIITKGLSIDNNPNLTTIASLSSATNAMNGNNEMPFRIFNNPVLTSLDGINFSSITNVIDVQISNMPLIQNLNALSALSGYFNFVRIGEMDQLTNLNGLNNITSINTLNISNNSLITSLPNWNLSSLSGILIVNNPALLSIESLSAATSLSIPTGSVALSISNNSSLTNLQGLQNIVSLNGFNISINNNSSLTDISALNNVNISTIGFLSIGNNTNLSACNETWVCDLLALNNDIAFISNNAPSCSDNQTVVNNCSSNPCPSGDVSFFSQTDVNTFVAQYPNCTTLNGGLQIGWDLAASDIDNLSGLSNITTINGDFGVINNGSLTSLNGLQNVTLIVGEINISQNNILQDISQLSGLTALNSTTASGLSIQICPSLTSLNGLQNITNANNAGIFISNNDSLISIDAISNIVANTINFLEIFGNTVLSNCAITSVCQKIAIDEASVFINNNATNCSTIPEVQTACEALSTSDFNLTNDIQIYPNPFNNHISIALGGDYQNVKTTLVDVTGKQFFSKTFSGNTIEINQLDSLSSGIYFVTIELENGKTITQKIVK